MIHFITMYHPDAVTPEYRVQYAEHVELEGIVSFLTESNLPHASLIPREER